MNPLFFVLGIPVGILIFLIGDKLARKTKKHWVSPMLLVLWIFLVVILDMVF